MALNWKKGKTLQHSGLGLRFSFYFFPHHFDLNWLSGVNLHEHIFKQLYYLPYVYFFFHFYITQCFVVVLFFFSINVCIQDLLQTAFGCFSELC